MIVDSSAVVAVVCREPGFESPLNRLVSSTSTGIGTPTLAETGIVLSARLRRDPRGLLVRLLDEFEIVEVPFGEPHWREAIRAYWRYGRGRHRANLNYGDFLSYAVAHLAQEPLLFIGEGFASTDVDVA